jgi:Resolvase, N terminal domain
VRWSFGPSQNESFEFPAIIADGAVNDVFLPSNPKYGYARVSTDDQTAALQRAALTKAGCKTIFKDEGLSGATTKRPALLS